MSTKPERALQPAILRGLRGRCPRCGEGRIFHAYLKSRDACAECAEALHHHRADDAPAWLTILVVGHLVGGGVVYTETSLHWPVWVNMTLWPLVGFLLCLILLPRFKGAIIAMQWALRMHGFASERD